MESYAELKHRIQRALSDARSDRSLLDTLSTIAKDWRFGSFTYLFGPGLWRRNRVLFRPFILAHFDPWALDDHGNPFDPWDGPHGPELEAWHRSADDLDDVEMFCRLHAWKMRSVADKTVWEKELVDRVRRAPSPARRRTELAKFEWMGPLEEPAALALYEQDPVAARPFIERHMLRRITSWWKPSSGTLWESLHAAAERNGDFEFASIIYKRTADDARWRRDVMQLAERVFDGGELCDRLKRLQVEWLPADAALVFGDLLRARGEAVIPYVLHGIQSLRRSFVGASKGVHDLAELAWERRWFGLWGAVLRVGGTPAEFNEQVRRVLRDTFLPVQERRRCLLLLAGVGREVNLGPLGIASVQPLDDDVATELYEREPDLLRGPFRKHVLSGWQVSFPRLTEAVMKANDEPLIDYLASRMVTRSWFDGDRKTSDVIDRLSRYYEAMAHDEARFARRGASVLSEVPAFVVYGYAELIKKNRLARVLWERKRTAYLACDQAIRDLLEAPQIFAQILAFRALGSDDDRARRIARDNLDLLCAALLRPLHRKARLEAFAALWRAAEGDENAARHVLAAAMDAFALPDQRYPKEALLALVARIKHAYPALRSPTEHPVIHVVEARA